MEVICGHLLLTYYDNISKADFQTKIKQGRLMISINHGRLGTLPSSGMNNDKRGC